MPNVALLLESALIQYFTVAGVNLANSQKTFDYTKYNLTDDDLVVMGFKIFGRAVARNACIQVSCADELLEADPAFFQ